MRSKKMKGRKAILSLLLSAALVMEPLGTAAIVRAEENDGTAVQTAAELEGDIDQTEELPDEAEAGQSVEEDTEKNEEDAGLPEDGQTEESSPKDEEGGNLDESSADDNKEETPDEISDETPGDEDNQDSGDEQQPEDEAEPETDGSEETDQDEEKKDSVSENNLDEEAQEEKDEALEGFTEMPGNYRLNAMQMKSKRELADHLDDIMKLDEGSDYAAGEVVLLVDTQEEAEMIAKAYNAEIKKFNYGVLTLKLNKSDTVAKAMRAAADEELNLPAVWPNYYIYAYGEADMKDDISAESTVESNDLIEVETTEYELEALGLTDEPSYQAASYSDPYLSPYSFDYYQYHHTVIGSTYAWEAGYTGSGIEVAVLDTGVNSSHADLPSVTGVGASATDDSNGHGTHVAGIIAASANGQWGVGVAPDVTLYAGNVLPNNGSGTMDDAMTGVRAVSGQAGANITVDVINMSLGSLYYNDDFQTVITAAYENGVAIFAAAGNDGGNNYNYPACYDHVISVAATDQSNARASFSNYGNKVDLSAPGVAIWSTNAFSGMMTTTDYVHEEYIDMSGTSMACPVAAGEAAVILSANPAELQGKAGGDKVDALLKLMQENTVKVSGSGMGKGITHLAKVFNINMLAEKPTAPVIDIKADEESQKVTVTMEAQARMQIYYTDNGKNPVYKDGAPDGNTKLYTDGGFEINNRTKGEVRAIAVNEAGGCSNIVKKEYTLKPYVRDIMISGVNQVAKGKSIQLSAAVTPTYAANKAVVWEIYTAGADGEPDKKVDSSSGVSITNKGMVTAKTTAKTGSYVVKVTAKDEKKDSSGNIIHAPAFTTYRITVTDAAKVNSVKFNKKSLTLVIPVDVSCDLKDNNFVAKQKDGTDVAASEFRWSSNKETVATVDADGVVTPRMAGKAVITALANDSSGKKATCTITVQQLAQGLEISGSTVVGKSKSNTYKAVVTPANATNKKVTWSLSEKDGQGQWQEMNSRRAKALGVSINASGRLTATSNATAGEYLIKAVTKDDAKQVAEKEVTVKAGVIRKITVDPDTKTIYRTTNVFGAPTSVIVSVEVTGTNGADLNAYTVTSSDVKENIARVEEGVRNDNGTSEFTVTATGKATGKVTITVKATDGSNMSAKCTVNVSNSASGIRIAPSGSNSEYVAKGKSLQLKAIMETGNGTVSNKNVKWILMTTGGTEITPTSDKVLKTGMKIASNGKVTASTKAEDGWYIVAAGTQDGSVAMYWIRVAAPTTTLKLDGFYNKGTTVFDENYDCLVSITSDIKQGGFSVSSSNPAVVSVGIYQDGTGKTMELVTGKKGSATITVKALDGSGKQVKYKVKVDRKLWNSLK